MWRDSRFAFLHHLVDFVIVFSEDDLVESVDEKLVSSVVAHWVAELFGSVDLLCLKFQ